MRPLAPFTFSDTPTPYVVLTGLKVDAQLFRVHFVWNRAVLWSDPYLSMRGNVVTSYPKQLYVFNIFQRDTVLT